MTTLDKCVRFLQRLIQTQSLPGHESEIAELVRFEMEGLKYDEVVSDDAGNVIGVVRGEGKAPDVMFNTHLDHVDIGDPERWPFPPYGGEIHEDRVFGRGAMDIKGPLAAQVYGISRLITEGQRPPGDVYVSAVVQEEVGGLGARHLVSHLQPALVVVGEASRNELRRGHRGRTELVLHVRGKSVHASVPETGVNPLHVVARFISALDTLKMRDNPDTGPSSVAVTLIRTDQTSPNVVPAEAWLTCDWRNVPGETAAEAQQALQKLADESLIPGAEARILIPTFQRVSYTGLEEHIPADNPAYALEADHAAVQAAEAVLSEFIGLNKPATLWKFATDGGHFAQAGLTVIGYGPGEEELAHTVRESIEIAELEKALRGNHALALHWPKAAAAHIRKASSS